MSDLTHEYRATFFTTSTEFDDEGVNRVLEELRAQCQTFVDGPGSGAESHDIEYTVEARYASQVWEIEVPLIDSTFANSEQLAKLVEDFHATHEQIFAIRDPGSVIEFVGWTATARCRVSASDRGRLQTSGGRSVSGTRTIYFVGVGEVDAVLYDFETMDSSVVHRGPAIIESPFTTVVADAETTFQRTATGSLLMQP
jgi:N-methylhydantoinase A